MSLLSVVGLGLAVFTTTNIDDILLLSAFFADPALGARAVVVGQFAGIGLLTTVSAVAALLALAVPPGWIALLGLAPLALGLRGLYELFAARGGDRAEGVDEGLHAQTAAAEASSHSHWIAVALVTIANGGDNLGVYIPLFSRELTYIPVYASVFAVMTAVWCLAGYWLVNHRLLGARIRQYGHVALPFVLVALGIHILWDARALLP